MNPLPTPAASAPGRRLPTIARLLMGVPLLVFGLNAFLNFLPQPKTPLPPGAVAFFGALLQTGYMMPLIGATLLIVGILLVLNRFVPLALTLFAPLLVNILLFHLCLQPGGLPVAGIFLVLELYLAWVHRRAFAALAAPRSFP